MTRTVICGVGHRTPPAVAELASALAAELRSDLQLVHVVKDHEPAMTGQRRRQWRDIARREAEQLLDGLPPDARMADRRVEIGEPAQELINAARDADAELIVVGWRAHRALAPRPLRSVASKLAGSAPCPLVVFPPQAVEAFQRGQGRAGHGCGPVVCELNGNGVTWRAAVLAADIAHRLGVRLVAVRPYVPAVRVPARPPPPLVPSTPEEVQQATEQLGDHVEVVYRPGPPADALNSAAEDSGARLIALGVDHSQVDGPWAATQARQLLKRASCPLLVLPEQAAIEPGTHLYELALGSA